MQYAFYFDQSRCIGCNTCTVACKDWNQVNPGSVRWRKQETYEIDGGFYSMVMSCNHCEKPACVDACAVQAISKRPDGIVVIDRTKCEELGACLEACPFSAPHIAGDKQEPTKKNGWKVKHPAQKCDFCLDRLGKSELPVCVGSCPSHALDCGEIQDLMKKYPDAERLNAKSFPYAYGESADEGTSPCLFIKKRKPLAVTDFNEG